MRKISLLISSLILFLGITLFSACKKDDNNTLNTGNGNVDLIGKWYIAKENITWDYDSSGTPQQVKYEYTHKYLETDIWNFKTSNSLTITYYRSGDTADFTYTVTNNKLSLTQPNKIITPLDFSMISSDVFTLTLIEDDGQNGKTTNIQTFNRVK